MEKRSVSYLVLTASAVVVVAALIFLLIKVRSAPPAATVEPSEVASPAPPSPQAESSSGSGEPQLPTAKRLSVQGAEPSSGQPPAPPPAPPPANVDPIPQERPADVTPNPAPTSAEPSQALQETMAQATAFFDDGEYEKAIATANDVLNQRPDEYVTDRMLRIAASSSCFIGQAEQARSYYDKLTPRSQVDVARRCRRFGIEF